MEFIKHFFLYCLIKIRMHKRMAPHGDFDCMGDSGIEVEENLIKKYNLKDIDVLKVGHHGSKTNKEFIDSIDLKCSIISVGKNNSYGYPNKDVLNNLEE